MNENDDKMDIENDNSTNNNRGNSYFPKRDNENYNSLYTNSEKSKNKDNSNITVKTQFPIMKHYTQNEPFKYENKNKNINEINKNRNKTFNIGKAGTINEFLNKGKSSELNKNKTKTFIDHPKEDLTNDNIQSKNNLTKIEQIEPKSIINENTNDNIQSKDNNNIKSSESHNIDNLNKTNTLNYNIKDNSKYSQYSKSKTSNIPITGMFHKKNIETLQEFGKNNRNKNNTQNFTYNIHSIKDETSNNNNKNVNLTLTNSNEENENEDKKYNSDSNSEEEKKQNEDSSSKRIKNNNRVNEENILNNPSQTSKDNEEIKNSMKSSNIDDNNKSSSYMEKFELINDSEQNINPDDIYYLSYLNNNYKNSPIEIKMIINNTPYKMVIPLNSYTLILKYIGSDIEPRNIDKIIKSTLKCNIIRLLNTIKKYDLSKNDNIKELLNTKKILYLLNNDEKINLKEINISSNSSNEISTLKKKSNLILENKSFKGNYSLKNYCEALEELYIYYLYIINSIQIKIFEPKREIIINENNMINNSENNLNESDIIEENEINLNSNDNNNNSLINPQEKNLNQNKDRFLFLYRISSFILTLGLMIQFFIYNWS